MSETQGGAGLRLLRERAAAVPAALRLAASGPEPTLRAGGTNGFVVTGIGSSGAHARYLVHLLATTGGLRARFASPGEFLADPPAHARTQTLVVFSQGLSPNARFALAHARAYGRVVLVTSTPDDGGSRDDAAEKRALLRAFDDGGACIVRLPGADEYGTLLRLVGPMVGYVAALRLARAAAPHVPAFDVDAICSAVSAAPGRLAPALPAAGESVAFVALGAAAELAENLRLKLIEGLRRPSPPVWDLLQLAHGPWQELHDHPALLLALAHRGAAPEAHALAQAEALLVPGRHRLLRLEATLPPPLSIFEHEALVNELVLRGIEAAGPDPARWPGCADEGTLYRMAPGSAVASPPTARAERSRGSVLELLAWPEVGALVAGGVRTAVVPLGATEQHGMHLPLDTDTRIADALAERFCAAAPEAVRLRALPVGCSREHLGFPGTLDLRVTTLGALLLDVVDSLVRSGFECVFLFSAHGGNDAALRAMLPALRAAAAPAQLIAFTGLARIIEAQARASAAEGIGAEACGHHAGEHETSILLGLDPEAVRADRMEPGRLVQPEDAQALFHPTLRDVAPNGVVGDPSAASGARAERYLAAWTSLLVEAYRSEKNAK